MSTNTRDNRFLPLAISLAWLGAAIAVGVSHVLEPLPRPVIQAILAGLTIALLIGAFAVPRMRAWTNALPLRVLVGLHLTRVIAGATFLWFYDQGRLPHGFAVPGGWGDIAVGALAIGVLAIGPDSPRGRWPTFIWNCLGLIDILFVVATAARFGLNDPPSIVELARLPLCVLPLFLVPLVIASHIVIFRRLALLRTTAA